jgi:hypothetical protein
VALSCQLSVSAYDPVLYGADIRCFDELAYCRHGVLGSRGSVVEVMV